MRRHCTPYSVLRNSTSKALVLIRVCIQWCSLPWPMAHRQSTYDHGLRGCWRRGGLAASGTLAPPGIKLSGCMWLPCAEESFLEALGAPDSGSTRALHVAPRRGRGFCHQVQKADAASLPPAMLDHEPRRLVPPSPGEATTLFNSGRRKQKPRPMVRQWWCFPGPAATSLPG